MERSNNIIRKLKTYKMLFKTSFYNSPVRVITISFFCVITVGTLLLMMPFSSNDGQFTNFVDSLFTATSATCVTGLIAFDTYTKWSIFGQIVLLALIQVGGLGLITFVTFFNISIGKKMGLKNMQLAQESISHDNISEVKRLIKMVVSCSFIIELIGALLLMIVFVPKYAGEGIYISIFLAISAFCNAGFDILGREGPCSSLMNYNDQPLVIIVICALIIIGGLGFVVWSDLLNFRKTKRLMFHTKIVLMGTIFLIVVGTVIFFLMETNNPKTMGNMPTDQKITASFMQSVTTRTAGFNSVDNGQLTGFSKLVSIFLMFIGAAPGSTGGGIKVTTFVVIIMTVISFLKNEEDTKIRFHVIDKKTVYRSFAIFFLAAAAVMVSSCIIFFSNPQESNISGLDAVYESVSAIATVGVSTGITASLNALSKMVLSLTMFIGRVGPVTLAFTLMLKQNSSKKNHIVPEGKILVG